MSVYKPGKYAFIRAGSSLAHEKDINRPLREVSKGCGYYVTDLGEFYRKYDDSRYAHVVSRPVRQTGGYRYVHLYNQDGSVKSYRAHRLVAEAWLDNPSNLPVVGHKNNIKTDNRVENLCWTTYSENIKKSSR